MVATRYIFGKGCLEEAFGRYDKTLEGDSPTDARKAIQALVARHRSLDAIHAKVVGNDGRIVGTERSHLLEGLDAILLAAVVGFRKLSGAKELNLAESPETDQPLMLVFDLDGWVLRGRLVLKRGGYKGSFMDYHREELSPRLREFLEIYRRHADDASLSEEETAYLLRALRALMVSVIELYALVYQVKVNA